MAAARGKWTQETLENCMKAVSRQNLPVREAAQRFGIPRRTLRNHLETGSVEKRIGRKPLLATKEEEELVKRILRFCDLGLPLTAKMIRSYVFDYMDKNNMAHPFTNNMAGEKWFRLFMQRWPMLRRRKAQPMNPARAQKLNRFIVRDHFSKLKDTLENMRLLDQPHRIYNLDEKGCRLALHHQQSVIAKKGQKRVHLVAPEHGENVTVVACANAVGGTIPPMIIFKGKRRREHFGDTLPPLSCFEMAEKGSMTHEIFVKWLQHFAEFKPSGKVLMIFDGAKCHLSPSIVDEADKHEITLFCLPSNTTHELQPLDVAVFRAFEHYWDEEVLSFWRQQPSRSLTKELFGKIFTPVWNKTMTISNIQSGFKKCGIFPFDCDAIPDHAFAPSDVTNIASIGENEQELSVQPSTSAQVVVEELSHTQQPSTSVDMPSQPLAVQNASLYDPSTTMHEKSPEPATSSDVISPPSALSTSFSSIMSTPAASSIKKKKRVQRKKSINYRATVISKTLFYGKEKSNENEKKKKKSVAKKNKSIAKNWYCPICEESTVSDMRQCVVCLIWFHEECVGLTINDEDDFCCPDCDN